MDWNILLCFVWINFASIQGLSYKNNVDLRRLIKFLQRKTFISPFNNEIHPKILPTKIDENYDIGKNTNNYDGKRYYAVVNFDLLNGKPRNNKPKEPTYHGNEKYSPLRNGERHKSLKGFGVNFQAKSKESKKIETPKPMALSSEEIAQKHDDANIYSDVRKIIPGKLLLKNPTLLTSEEIPQRNDAAIKYPDGKKTISFKWQSLNAAIVSSEEIPQLYFGNKKIIPGKTLLQLKNKDLASAAKFPVPEKSSLVYGNLENLGITYGKTNQRLAYSGFRKSNDILDLLLNTPVSKSNSRAKKWIIIEIAPEKLQKFFLQMKRPIKENEENNGNEILDGYDDGYETGTDYRRKKAKTAFRMREEYGMNWNSKKMSSESDTDEDSMSSSEKNPGNPFTLFKGKYKQNYMWNHYMDGDHMNINPYSPLFHDMGATGQDLYFGRKWWYFNQDDYKPMG